MKETYGQNTYIGIDPFSTTNPTYSVYTTSDNNTITLGQRQGIDNGFCWTGTQSSLGLLNQNYQQIPSVEKFDCFVTSEGRITEAKRETLFNLFEKTTQEYLVLVKYLNIEEKLFNTVLLEYAIKHKTSLFMELLVFKQNFTKWDLYNAVVKIYK